METYIELAYLFSAVLFILGLKKLGSAKTARTGNNYSIVAMALAIVISLVSAGIIGPTQIIVGLLAGSLIGFVMAKRVEMTSMPQLVALFNGFGGIASTLVAYAELIKMQNAGTSPALDISITIMLSILIGTVTFTGSLIAFAKLQGILKGAPIVLPAHQALNLLLMLGIVAGSVLYIFNPPLVVWPLVVLLISAVFGITFVIPIGGADMPVVIALLNSYSGLAASATGFVLGNNVLIIAGALVGASGIILTNLMCVAMNRSVLNVLFGAVGTSDGDGSSDAPGGEQRNVTRYTGEDAAMIMDTINSVIIVPGLWFGCCSSSTYSS